MTTRTPNELAVEAVIKAANAFEFIKLHQQGSVSGNVAAATPAYQLLTCWQVANKFLTDNKELIEAAQKGGGG